jgi:hypothetical protein
MPALTRKNFYVARGILPFLTTDPNGIIVLSSSLLDSPSDANFEKIFHELVHVQTLKSLLTLVTEEKISTSQWRILSEILALYGEKEFVRYHGFKQYFNTQNSSYKNLTQLSFVIEDSLATYFQAKRKEAGLNDTSDYPYQLTRMLLWRVINGDIESLFVALGNGNPSAGVKVFSSLINPIQADAATQNEIKEHLTPKIVPAKIDFDITCLADYAGHKVYAADEQSSNNSGCSLFGIPGLLRSPISYIRRNFSTVTSFVWTVVTFIPKAAFEIVSYPVRLGIANFTRNSQLTQAFVEEMFRTNESIAESGWNPTELGSFDSVKLAFAVGGETLQNTGEKFKKIEIPINGKIITVYMTTVANPEPKERDVLLDIPIAVAYYDGKVLTFTEYADLVGMSKFKEV